MGPAFVLGALERDEERAVAEHVRTCPHGEQELAAFAEFGAVIPALLESVPLVEPPASLRGRIRAAASRGPRGTTGCGGRRRVGRGWGVGRRGRVGRCEAAGLSAAAGVSAAAGAVSTTGPAAGLSAAAGATTPPGRVSTTGPAAGERAGTATPGNVVVLDAARRRRLSPAWGLAAAAVVAVLVLGAVTVSSQQQLADARAYQQRLTAALVQAGQPGSQVAVITSTGQPGTGPGGIAVMPASGSGTLVMSGLAPTTGTQVYEAWAIAQGQPPVPVAGFTVGPDGVGYINNMPEAPGEPVIVAITLEPRPNPTAPSSEPIAAGVAAPPAAAG